MPPKANKVEVELRKIARLEGNKTCADCPEKMPGYADLTHNIFVCTKCAGIHRDFQFKVKGISMSVFSEEDVAMLASVGNDVHNAKFLAKLNPKDFSFPNGSDPVKLKEFIKQKYVDKKWHQDDPNSFNAQSNNSVNRRASTGSTNSNSFSIKPLNKTGPNLGSGSGDSTTQRSSSITVGKQASQNFGLDLLSLGDDSVHTNSTFGITNKNGTDQYSNNTSSKFDAFESATPIKSNNSQPQNFDPFSSNNPSTSVGFGAFSSPPGNKAVPNSQPFGQGNNYPPSNGFGAFGGPPSNVNAFHSAQPSFYGQPQPVHTAPMPFIKIAPPTPAVEAPVPEKKETAVTGTGTNPPTKNFSAFDDLLSADIIPNGNQKPTQPTAPSVNPFEANHPPSFGYPQTQFGGNQPPPHFNHNQGPYPYPPGQHGFPGYPQHPQQPPPGYPYPYPPPPYGGGYPPQQASSGYGQAPPGYAPGYPAPPPGYAYGYGAPPPGQGPPVGVNGPVAVPGQNPNAAPAVSAAPPAQPDPFAAMGGMAWNAVGSTVPTTKSAVPPQVVNLAPQLSAPTPSAPSVNPFDMF